MKNSTNPHSHDQIISNSLPKQNYASFVQRMMAYITDSLILGLLTTGSLAYLLSINNQVDLIYRSIILITLVFIPAVVFGIIYHAWFLSQSGATLGKQIWGVEIVDSNHQHLSFGMAFFREVILKQVSYLSLGLGFLWMIKQSDKQTWHDMLIGTYAKSTNKPLLISILWFLSVLVVQVGLLYYSISQLPVFIQLLSSFIKL